MKYSNFSPYILLFLYSLSPLTLYSVKPMNLEDFWESVNEKASAVFGEQRKLVITSENLPHIEALITFFNTNKEHVRIHWGNSERLQACEEKISEYEKHIQQFKTTLPHKTS